MDRNSKAWGKMQSLEGKVAIVTGASQEIGAAMAQALAAAGAAVFITHHAEPELAQAVVDRIRATGGRAEHDEADLRSIGENQRLVAKAVEAFGRLDIFVANAGITAWGPFLDVNEDIWDNVVDLNLKGSFFGAQAAAREMVKRRTATPDSRDGGRIVFSSSVTGVVAVPDCSPYAVTKAGLRHMAKILALELGPHQITVNALGIGATVNARNLRDDPDYEARWARVIPNAQCGQPKDVASALMYLVSEEARMITGHTLMIDGGWSDVGHAPPSLDSA